MRRSPVKPLLFALTLLTLAGCMAAPVSNIRPEPTPVTLNGMGRIASQGPFNLTAGERVFTVTHNGRSNFGVRLLRSDRSFDGQVVNVIGAYQGNHPYQVRRSGQYYVEVQADGAWTISVN